MFVSVCHVLEREPAGAAIESNQVQGIFDGGDAVLYSKGLVEGDKVMLEFFGFVPTLLQEEIVKMNAMAG